MKDHIQIIPNGEVATPAPEQATEKAPEQATEQAQETAQDNTLLARGDSEFGLEKTGKFDFKYRLTKKFEILDDIKLSVLGGRISFMCPLEALVKHIIHTTPTKKDDKIYDSFEGFLTAGITFLAFHKTLDPTSNVGLDTKGVFTFESTIPTKLSELNKVTIILEKGKIFSSVDLEGLVEALVKQSHSKMAYNVWEDIKGLVDSALKIFSFKKKISL